MKKIYVVQTFPNRYVLGVYSNPRMAYDSLVDSCEGRHGIDVPSYRTCLKHLRNKGFINFQDKQSEQTLSQIGRYCLNEPWQKK